MFFLLSIKYDAPVKSPFYGQLRIQELHEYSFLILPIPQFLNSPIPISQVFFDLFCQGRNNVKEVAHHAVIGLLEYGGILILVDCNNYF